MIRLHKALSKSLFDLSLELELGFSYNPNTQGMYLSKLLEDGSINMTTVLYLDMYTEEVLIDKFDKVVAEAYEL